MSFLDSSLCELHKVIITLPRQMIFKLSLQEKEGDNKVVNLVKKWIELKNYAVNAPGGAVHAYQVFEEEKITEVRVLVGKYGFIKEYSDLGDKELGEIMSFCNFNAFLDISSKIADDRFFQ
jgi:hypothetical protein